MMKLISMFSKNVNVLVKDTAVILITMSNLTSRLCIQLVNTPDFTIAMLTRPKAIPIFR